MSLWNQITQMVKDPRPAHLFELSEAGIAFAHGSQQGFQPFAAGTLVASPVEDNLKRPDLIAGLLARVAPSGDLKNGAARKRRAAVILPDYSARVTVLDFDSFPSSPEEQLSLVRFRVKKTVPFDIDAAAVSCHVQPANGTKKVEVVAVTVALEVIARYEALFRNAGFHAGEITTSSLAALNLHRGEGVSVVAKLAGHVLTAMVLAGNSLKLFRCVTLEEASEEEILAVLHPTLAYIEDEMGSPPAKLVLCGFSNAPAELRCETEPLRSRLGSPEPFNAGLLGYLEGAGS